MGTIYDFEHWTNWNCLFLISFIAQFSSPRSKNSQKSDEDYSDDFFERYMLNPKKFNSRYWLFLTDVISNG